MALIIASIIEFIIVNFCLIEQTLYCMSINKNKNEIYKHKSIK